MGLSLLGPLFSQSQLHRSIQLGRTKNSNHRLSWQTPVDINSSIDQLSFHPSEQLFAVTRRRPGTEHPSMRPCDIEIMHRDGSTGPHIATILGKVSGWVSDDLVALVGRQNLSGPAILRVVDAVFSAAGAHDGVLLDDNAIEHHASREGDGGLVELWPPVKPREIDTPVAWKPPVERIEGDSPPARLAQLIAERIRRMIEDKEQLESKGRSIRAGDIMILLRRRAAPASRVFQIVRDTATVEQEFAQRVLRGRQGRLRRANV